MRHALCSAGVTTIMYNIYAGSESRVISHMAASLDSYNLIQYHTSSSPHTLMLCCSDRISRGCSTIRQSGSRRCRTIFQPAMATAASGSRVSSNSCRSPVKIGAAWQPVRLVPEQQYPVKNSLLHASPEQSKAICQHTRASCTCKPCRA